MNIGGIIAGFKDRGKVIYFREGYTFKTSNLPIEDCCLILKEKDKIVKAWGHSPGALLPLEGNKAMVQLVNARDGNPCDPFEQVKKGEKFSDSSIKVKAKEQHYKAVNTSSGTGMSNLQLLILGIATFLFLIGGISWAIQNWKW